MNYLTTMDVAMYHGKVVLITGDWCGRRECIPIIMPPKCAFEWRWCNIINDKPTLAMWYADDSSEYGLLWAPTANNGAKVNVKVPWMFALPLQAAQMYHTFKQPVMSHKLPQTH